MVLAWSDDPRHGGVKLAQGEGLGEAGAGVLLQEILEAVLDDVAGHEKHAPGGRRLARQELLVEVHPVEAGHFPVGDDDDQPSARRLNEQDKPFTYASDQEVKPVSASGHVAHEGRNYHLGEAFAHKRVGLRLNAAGQTEVHFANVHLGHLAYDAEGGRFKPTAYVAPAKPAPVRRQGG